MTRETRTKRVRHFEFEQCQGMNKIVGRTYHCAFFFLRGSEGFVVGFGFFGRGFDVFVELLSLSVGSLVRGLPPRTAMTRRASVRSEIAAENAGT